MCHFWSAQKHPMAIMVIKSVLLDRAGHFNLAGTECYKTALNIPAEALAASTKLDTMLKEYLH